MKFEFSTATRIVFGPGGVRKHSRGRLMEGRALIVAGSTPLGWIPSSMN